MKDKARILLSVCKENKYVERVVKMCKMNIFDMLVYRFSGDVYQEIEKGLAGNASYTDSINSIKTHLLRIDRKLSNDIFDEITRIETEVKKTSYSQGFSDAVKLIMTCMSGGGYDGK